MAKLLFPFGYASPSSPQLDSKDFLSKTTKRTHSPLACEYCHQNHLKCDGHDPCSQCLKKKISCSYSAPGKRGPKPGVNSLLKNKVAEQENFIQLLTEELARVKQEKEEWRQKYIAVTQSLSRASLQDFTSLDQNFVKYFHLYRLYIHPIFPLLSILDQGDPLLYLNSSEPEHRVVSLQINVALAHGARLCEEHSQAERLINLSKQRVQEFFDQTSYEVAHILQLIAFYYFGNGDHNKTSYYTDLARKCCATLGLLETTLVGRKIISFLATESDGNEYRPYLARMWSVDPQISEISWILSMEVYIELTHLKTLSSLPMLRKFQEIENFVRAQSLHMSEFDILNIQVLLSGCRAGFLWNDRLRQSALQIALQALPYLQSELFRFCSPLVLFSVCMILQIYLAEGKLLELAEGLKALARLGRHYALAEGLHKKFQNFFNNVQQTLCEPQTRKRKSPSSNLFEQLLSTSSSSLSNSFEQEKSSLNPSLGVIPSFPYDLIMNSQLDLLGILAITQPSTPWFIRLNS